MSFIATVRKVNLIFIFLILLQPCYSMAASTRIKHHQRYSFQVERDLHKRGYNYVIGSDESGRGSIAGPVVTASCCVLWRALLNQHDNNDEFSNVLVKVKDSKLLSSEDRVHIYNRIASRPDLYVFETAQRSNEQIDSSNVLKSTMDCFRESIQGLVNSRNFPSRECYSVVDGKNSPKLDARYRGIISCRPYVKADSEVYTVALASIIAKVTHDRIMKEDAHALYPQYDFPNNLGYCTKDHILSIHKYGKSPLHRTSFRPLKNR